MSNIGSDGLATGVCVFVRWLRSPHFLFAKGEKDDLEEIKIKKSYRDRFDSVGGDDRISGYCLYLYKAE